jgi:2-oxoglutarate dehydrogenase complex dehydrogenase (E1) component-like enzyme
VNYDQEYFDGDVKYHLGLTADKVTRSRQKNQYQFSEILSHLETVGAVIEGITRAKQDKYFPEVSQVYQLPFTVMQQLQVKEILKSYKWHN